ncbi:cyanophycinase [Myxococcota bacterium]|nr:cyanophycinase [Myxococcota bacterium]
MALAGGGAEGDVGDAESWSARLYGGLLSGGDVTEDGLVRVAVLSAAEESEWLPEYFVWLGADEAQNWNVSDEAALDDLADTLSGLDGVFFKGGDQSVYYDLLVGGELAAELQRRHREAGLAVGGTSAGAMILGEWALAGGRDSTSEELLANGRSSLLTDLDGGSGIKPDALGLLPGGLVETHFTERGRLGRLVACLAAAVDEGAPPALLGFGLEQRTGLLVLDGVATVIGEGSVAVLDPVDATNLRRESGVPLQWTGLGLNLLTEGWAYDLSVGDVILGPDAEAVAWDGVATEPEESLVGWVVNGDETEDEERLAWVAERAPYNLRAGAEPPRLPDAVAFMDAHAGDYRGENQALMFRALYDLPGATGLLIGEGGMASADEAAPTTLLFTENLRVVAPEVAALVVSGAGVTARGLAPGPSPSDAGDGSLHDAALIGLTLHTLSDAGATGLAYDTARRSVVTR